MPNLTDTTEKGFETLIMRHIAQQAGCSRVRLFDPLFDKDKAKPEEVKP